MKRLIAVVMSVLASVAAVAEDDAPAAPQYTCSLKVEPSKMSHQQEKDGYDRTKTTTTTWPVKVSFGGKDIPTSGIVLKACFIGNCDGTAKVLGETTTDVKLEKNVFKTDIVSPPVTLTKSVERSSGYSSGGSGWGRKTTTTGTRLTGCIIQLVVDGKVKKSYASKPSWRKLAQADTLDTNAILKIL